MPPVLLLSCLPLGVAAGLIAGLLGVGGGLLIVPALAFLLPSLGGLPQEAALPTAVATSLASILITAPVSAASHLRRAAVDWRAVLWLSPGLLAGALLAAVVMSGWPVRTLALVLAVFFAYAAWRMIRQERPRPEKAVAVVGLLPAGLGIGALSAVVGIGGGTLIVPLLLRLGRSIHRAIGTAAACGLPIAFGGVLGWHLGPRGETALWWEGALLLGAGSALSAPLGAALAHRASARRLRQLFAAFLLLSAAAIAWRHL